MSFVHANKSYASAVLNHNQHTNHLHTNSSNANNINHINPNHTSNHHSSHQQHNYQRPSTRPYNSIHNNSHHQSFQQNKSHHINPPNDCHSTYKSQRHCTNSELHQQHQADCSEHKDCSEEHITPTDQDENCTNTNNEEGWQPVLNSRRHNSSHAEFQSELSRKQAQKDDDRRQRFEQDKESGRDAIVSVLACILEQLFTPKATDALPADPSHITLFHTERVPGITISAYLLRLAKYAECSAEVLVQCIIHINRILHHRPNFLINSLNIHRLVLTSLLCSAKFFDDTYFNNSYYAKVGGIGPKELNCLEVEFLALINFDLFVQFSVYEHFYTELCAPKLHEHCACRYKDMPQLLAEESYHPALAKQIEPEWNINEMIKSHSHSPKLTQRSLEKQGEQQKSSRITPVSNNNMSTSPPVNSGANNNPVLASTTEKRTSPSVASTADNSTAPSTAPSANHSTHASDNEEDNNCIQQAGDRKANKASRKKSKSRAVEECNNSAGFAKTAAMSVPSKKNKKNNDSSSHQSVAMNDYQSELNATRDKMYSLSIENSPLSQLLQRAQGGSYNSEQQFVGMSDSPAIKADSSHINSSANGHTVDCVFDYDFATANSNPSAFLFNAASAFTDGVMQNNVPVEAHNFPENKFLRSTPSLIA
jgi:hypothetical protein